MTGAYSMPPPGEESHARRQIAVIILLLFGMAALYQFEQFAQQEFDPSGMLAFGFVVLASYTIGGLVGQIRLPHITGYLIAGLVFGPSLANALGALNLPPPFDKGILNDDVIDQLSLLDTLAVALIALTAGGELKLEGLKKGLRAIASIMIAQLVSIGVLMTGFFWLISGAVPYIGLPGVAGLPMMAALAVGGMVASVSLATSPAATIAVIMESRSDGPMTRNVLSVVVLKDVIVVVAFAVAQVVVAQQMFGYSDPREFFVHKLAEGIATIAAAFEPHPVIVRLSDFKSNEYANLVGGERYEPHEENPMLGFRGASRYVDTDFRPCFEMECEALKRVREQMGFSNVWVMVPLFWAIPTRSLTAVSRKPSTTGLVSPPPSATRLRSPKGSLTCAPAWRWFACPTPAPNVPCMPFAWPVVTPAAISY